MDHQEDNNYIRQVLNGKISAYSYLVDRHKDRAYNLAYRISGNSEDAEEILQDSFLKAYRSLKNFRMKSSFGTWLYRIVYNTAVSNIRTRKDVIIPLHELPAESTSLRIISQSEEDADHEYRKAIVNFAMKMLNEAERGIITLHYFEELPAEEIAEITGLTRSALKVKLFRARKKMHESIMKYEREKSYTNEKI